MAYHVVFGANGVVVYQQKRVEYRKLNEELKSLQEENQRLNEHIKALQTDPKAIEKEAREQLRYAKPGEVIYVAPERPQADTKTAKK
jgi:cell division protein FtsB